MKKTTASPIDKKLAQALAALDRASQAIEKARTAVLGKSAGSNPVAKKVAKPISKKPAPSKKAEKPVAKTKPKAKTTKSSK